MHAYMTVELGIDNVSLSRGGRFVVSDDAGVQSVEEGGERGRKKRGEIEGKETETL